MKIIQYNKGWPYVDLSNKVFTSQLLWKNAYANFDCESLCLLLTIEENLKILRGQYSKCFLFAKTITKTLVCLKWNHNIWQNKWPMQIPKKNVLGWKHDKINTKN